MPPSSSRDPKGARVEPSSETKVQFRDTEWAYAMFSDPTLIPFQNDSRVLKKHTGDTFCASTLNSEDTISGWQSFYRFPASASDSSKGRSSDDGRGGNGNVTTSSPNQNEQMEILSVLKLGSGVNGHIDTCHGGFISLLLDEVIGSAAEYERQKNESTMTAYLKVDYKKPVPTPSVVLCRALLERREGKKLWGRGTVEDGRGGMLAVGEALFIVIDAARVGRAHL